MSKLPAILTALATGSLFAVGGCATQDEVQALRADIASLRSSIDLRADIAALRSSIEGASVTRSATGTTTGPPPAGYVKVSTLVKLPEFIPGLGTLYVRPETLPAGPFLAYDRDNRLASTIYMIPVSDIAARKIFEQLAVGATSVQNVDFYYTPGHPGVQMPHYHVVLWHMPVEAAKLQ